MCTLADRAVTGNPKVEPETHTDARADVAALRDGESIRDAEVAVATEAAGVGGWEDAGGVTANAAARGSREERTDGRRPWSEHFAAAGLENFFINYDKNIGNVTLI